MTEHNHHRGTRRKNGPGTKVITETILPREGVTFLFGKEYEVSRNPDGSITSKHHVEKSYMTGYPPTRPWRYNRNINKCFNKVGELSGAKCSAGTGYDHSNGHRGAARAVRGAKKYVNSRHRFHEKAATRELAKQDDDRDQP